MINPRPVIFDPQRGVVVHIPMGASELPLGLRNFLNSSFPTPVMKNLEADIMTRQYGDITLLRDQKRSIDRSIYPSPVNYQIADFGQVPIMDMPFIGTVDMELP